MCTRKEGENIVMYLMRYVKENPAVASTAALALSGWLVVGVLTWHIKESLEKQTLVLQDIKLELRENNTLLNAQNNYNRNTINNLHGYAKNSN